METFAAVVLAGGAGRRMGSPAKPTFPVGGVALVSRVLVAVRAARLRVVVAPSALDGLLPDDVVRTLESPPGGGPVAGAAAGLAALNSAARGARTGANPAVGDDLVVALLAADLPFLDETAVASLVAAAAGPGLDGAVAVDETGREQWLCGAWRAGALRARLAALGDPAGKSVRALLGELTAARVRLDVTSRPAGGPPPTFDCDTVDDLRRAEEWSHGQP